MTKTINKITKLYAGDKFAITTTDGSNTAQLTN